MGNTTYDKPPTHKINLITTSKQPNPVLYTSENLGNKLLIISL